jgi:hypothetical protein
VPDFDVAGQVKALMEHMEQQRLLELLSKLAPAAALRACCCRPSRLLLPPLTPAAAAPHACCCRPSRVPCRTQLAESAAFKKKQQPKSPRAAAIQDGSWLVKRGDARMSGISESKARN